MQPWRQIGRLLKAFLLCLLFFFFFFFLKFDRFAFLKRKCGTLSLGEGDTSALFQLFISQLDESASILSFGIDSVKCVLHFLINIPHFLYPEWLRARYTKIQDSPAPEMVFLRYFAVFGKHCYGDVYRHVLPSVIAKLGKANLAKYTHTHAHRYIHKRKEKEWKRFFFFKNDDVLNSWNSTSMNLHPRAITLQLNFSENNCRRGEERERERRGQPLAPLFRPFPTSKSTFFFFFLTTVLERLFRDPF